MNNEFAGRFFANKIFGNRTNRGNLVLIHLLANILKHTALDEDH